MRKSLLLRKISACPDIIVDICKVDELFIRDVSAFEGGYYKVLVPSFLGCEWLLVLL